MSKCPDCGRESVSDPCGYIALCGRRVEYADAPGLLYPNPDQWRERMTLADKCKKAFAVTKR